MDAFLVSCCVITAPHWLSDQSVVSFGAEEMHFLLRKVIVFPFFC